MVEQAVAQKLELTERLGLIDRLHRTQRAPVELLQTVSRSVPDGLWPAVTNRLYVISYIDWIEYGFAPIAFCDSGVRAIGSSG